MDWGTLFEQYGWIFAAVVLFLIELSTPGAFFGFILGISAALTFGLSLFVSSFFVQLLFFIILSALSLFYLRPFFLKITRKSENIPMQHEALLHQTGLVTKRITPTQPGIIQVAGQEWTAISDQVIERGAEVQLESLEGISYRVTKIHS